MSPRFGGVRPRPRVAILGRFKPKEVERFKELFPTMWLGASVEQLRDQVNAKEVDLLIVGKDIDRQTLWETNVHVICFSRDYPVLPGPIPNTRIMLSGLTETEEYVLPEMPLPFNQRREADLAELRNVKGWPRIKLSYSSKEITPQDAEGAEEILVRSAIIADSHGGQPLAVLYQRMVDNLGVAWLPYTKFNQAAWVELIVTHWAQSDRERFPDFEDWTKSSEWMVPDEIRIVAAIGALEDEKKKTATRISQEIGSLRSRLTETTLVANRGRRRLLTAQGNELVEEVTSVFREFGFAVQIMDEKAEPNSPKREDLRLRELGKEDGDWEAIVEVRGYRRSNGASADLGRLSRFAELYLKEKRRYPNKRIYVVNGPLELFPSHRPIPLASANEDIGVFAEQDGIVISTIDLFRVSKLLGQLDPGVVRESIKCTSGRWTVQSVHSKPDDNFK
jgi:hypothetical protein